MAGREKLALLPATPAERLGWRRLLLYEDLPPCGVAFLLMAHVKGRGAQEGGVPVTSEEGER